MIIYYLLYFCTFEIKTETLDKLTALCIIFIQT